MSFQIKLDKYEEAYGHFLKAIRDAIQKTFSEEEERGLTQNDIASDLGVDKSVVSRRLNGTGNTTLRSISDVYTAMGREPLANFVSPEPKYMKSFEAAAPNDAVINIHVVVINQVLSRNTALPVNVSPLIENAYPGILSNSVIPHDGFDLSYIQNMFDSPNNRSNFSNNGSPTLIGDFEGVE